MKKGTLACFFFALALALPDTSRANKQCPATHIDQISTIRYVHDGDTVTLKNGDKIRLIGINSPEIARKSKKHGYTEAQPFANAARDYLKQLLPRNTPVHLQSGADQFDHYGRTLAHLFLENGDNIQVKMLENGLAAVIAIPPNTSLASCYLNIEKQARRDKVGMWSDTSTILSSETLTSDTHGFHLVQGQVERVDINRHGIWITLKGRLTLGIRRENMPLFNLQQVLSLKNKTILVRGWINRRKGLYMRIRHPMSIETIN